MSTRKHTPSAADQLRRRLEAGSLSDADLELIARGCYAKYVEKLTAEGHAGPMPDEQESVAFFFAAARRLQELVTATKPRPQRKELAS